MVTVAPVRAGPIGACRLSVQRERDFCAAPARRAAATMTRAERQGAVPAPWTAQEAAGLAAPPSQQEDPVLYTHTLCPYAERVWIALLEKQVPFRLVHIDLSRKPAWFRSINPRGLVPAVQLGGTVHTESADICRWLDGAFSGGSQLVPGDAALRQEMEGLVSGPCSGAVSAGLDLMAGRTGRYWGIGSGQTAAQKAALEAELEQLAAALQRHGGPFLLGVAPTLPDILVYPFLYRFDVGIRGLAGYDLGAAGGGAIRRWLDAMAARPSCAASSADPQLLLAAFKKHMELDFFDYTTYPCFKLHPHNAHLLE